MMQVTSHTQDKAFAVGDVIADRYRLTRPLGKGGYSTVFAALDTQSSREVAVKILRHDVGRQDPSALARMRQEGLLLQKIRSEFIVRTDDFVVNDDGAFLIMEMLSGLSMAHHITRDGPAPSERVLPVAKQLLEALKAAHMQHVLHRDIKPENIILAPSDDPNVREIAKLVDFGLAKTFSPKNDDDDTPGSESGAYTLVRTRAGGFMGTPRYTPPEQAVGDQLGPYTDLFALGLVIAEWLTGQVRLKGDTHAVLMSNLVGPEPIPYYDTPQVWHRWFQRMLVKEPTERYQTAQEALYELEELVESVLKGGLINEDLAFDATSGRFVRSSRLDETGADESFLDNHEPLELAIDPASLRPAPAPPPHHVPGHLSPQGHLPPISSPSMPALPIAHASQEFGLPQASSHASSSAVFPVAPEDAPPRPQLPESSGSDFATYLIIGLLSFFGVLAIIVMFKLILDSLS